MIELTVQQAEYIADWLNDELSIELGVEITGLDVAQAVDAMNSVALGDLDPLLGYNDSYDDIGVLDE